LVKDFTAGYVTDNGVRDFITRHNTGDRDFNNIDLSGAELGEIHLPAVNLASANLSGAEISRTDLTGANLHGANLQGSKLSECHLTRAILTKAVFSHAECMQTYLAWASLEGADLTGANLIHADLVHADLSQANLTGATLRGAALLSAKLVQANLTGANLCGTYLDGANLSGANLSGAHLTGAVLTNTNLNDANLSQANIHSANLFQASLAGTNLQGTRCASTSFAALDVRAAVGMEEMVHLGPSTIGMDTVYESHGEIPEAFMRGCGVPDVFITFARSLVGAAIDFYSCFISYSTKDQEFADRRHADLQSRNVRCWFAPEDVQGGKKLYTQIDDAIRTHDKLLLLLSEHSMNSSWVQTEIRRARKHEMTRGKQVLFPVRLCSFEAIKNWECFDADAGEDLGVEIRKY